MLKIFLLYFAIFTGLGILFALLVLVPPIRRWARSTTTRRKISVISFPLLTGFIVFLLLAYASASMEMIYLCYGDIGILMEADIDAEDKTDYLPSVQQKKSAFFRRPRSTGFCYGTDATGMGFETGEELKSALVQEFLLRKIIPIPFRPDCFRDNQIFCEFTNTTTSSNGLGWFYLVILWPVVVTGLLTWWWTRPK